MDILPQLTIDDAAKYIGVSTKTLRRWETEGKIKPARTLGGQRRYSKEILKNIGYSAYTPTLLTKIHWFTSLQKQVLLWVCFIMSLTSSGIVLSKLISSSKPKFIENTGSVLAAETSKDDYRFVVNVPSLFNKDITAPNIIYGLTAGANIAVTGGQTPTISATVPDQTTDLKIFKTFKVGSAEISSGSKTDTLELVAGSNIGLSVSDKKITIANSYSAPSTGWEKSSDTVQLSATGNLLKIDSLTGKITAGIWNGTAIADTYLQNPILLVLQLIWPLKLQVYYHWLI